MGQIFVLAKARDGDEYYQKGVNYNLCSVTPRECLAELERAFISFGFPEETRTDLKQFVVLAVRHNRR